MNVQQDTVNPAEEAQKIWNQLEAEESGNAPAAAPADDAETTGQAPAANHIADAADAPKPGEDAAPSGDQALLDKIAGMETMLSQLTQRLRNAEGHIGGLGSQLKQQLQAAQQVTAKGGDAPTAGEIRDAQRSPEAMARLKADYPEFAEAMESALNERLSTLEQRMAQQAQQAQQAATGQSVTAEDIARLRAEMAVEVRHPGWQGLVQEPVFQGWLKRQPREVQMLAASESPQDAIRLLDLYGDSGKSAATQRTQRLNAASAIPNGRSGASSRQKAVEDMTPEEYWRYLDELDRQKR